MYLCNPYSFSVTTFLRYCKRVCCESLRCELLNLFGKPEVCEKSLTLFFLLPFDAVHFLGFLLGKSSCSTGSWQCPLSIIFMETGLPCVMAILFKRMRYLENQAFFLFIKHRDLYDSELVRKFCAESSNF